MASIEIDQALTGSHIAQMGFVASGTFTDDGGMFNITCSLTGNGNNFNGMVPSPVGGNWTASFPNLNVGSGYVLSASITGAPADQDDQTDITVDGTPPIAINTLPVMPNVDRKAPVTYTVTGTATTGVGVVCTAVTRDKKKIKSIDGTGSGPVKAGKWTVDMKIDQVGSGKKLTIIAVLLDENGEVIAQAGRGTKQK